ncbi:phosphate regulon sensor histidine kinase PhoR [Thalassotalea aquiviva]|uniref:phosphate regulon sensor histidine kinase PhoR n=1 Tax=Thalassotalea aquiviva TaxID=3242415 RepID=UPI003529E810
MIYRFSLKQFITKRLLIILASLLIGFWVGHVWLVLCISLGLTLLWTYRHLIGLINWLWHKKLLHPPESTGVWGHVYDGIYRRIKSYRKKQKKLGYQVRQFRDGAEALPDAAIVLDLDFAIRWANKKARRLLGIRWPMDSGQRINNLIRSPQLTKYLNKNDFTEPCSILAPDNDNQQLELRFMTYGDKQYLLLARDVSQSKRLERMRRDFVANVSHELKTPLTVVRGYVEMVQEDVNLPKHWSYSFKQIEEQVSRMDRLVEQLLVLSKVEVSSSSDEDLRSPIDMPEILYVLLQDAQWLNKEKQHQISSDIDSNLGIWGVASELKSACTNLLVNAMNYTEPGGKIHLSWYKDDKHCVFNVSDDGCGILPNDIERLSERFYRVDKSRSRDTGGTGLGLSIVKHVAQNHRAHLHIESVFGQGSNFSILFHLEDAVAIPEELG